MADSRRTNRRPFDPPPADAAVQRGERPWAEIKPSATHQATVRYANKHANPPLHLQLPDAIVRLLQRLENLQKLQRGEDVEVPGDGDPILASCDGMPPAQTEACLVGAVALICNCAFRAEDEVMILTTHEADAIRAERARDGTLPLSDIRAQQVDRAGKPSERQKALGEQLQKAIDPDWQPISKRTLTNERELV